jgi:hypothetical protein
MDTRLDLAQGHDAALAQLIERFLLVAPLGGFRRGGHRAKRSEGG